MTKPIINVSKENMVQAIKEELDGLESHARQLLATVELLKKTAQNDANMSTLKETKELFDNLPEVDIKTSISKVRKVISGRVKTLLREYGA